MPTVILLDVSLSMTRQVDDQSAVPLSILDLATYSIDFFLQRISVESKLECTALVVFSSHYEVVMKFTRDYEQLKKACSSLKSHDKTCIETALQGIETLVAEEWGVSVPVNVILITDGACGIGKGSLKDSLQSLSKSGKKFPLPFSFPCFLTILLLSPSQQLPRGSRTCFDKIIQLNNDLGELLQPEGSLNYKSVSQCIEYLLKRHYCKYEGAITCGHFKSLVTLHPTPSFQNTWGSILNLYKHPSDILDFSGLKVPSTLTVIGFLDMLDISNPPFLSRHLVLPIHDPPAVGQKRSKNEEDGKVPSFCVLLHGGLKTEKMTAIVQLSESWYGMLYSWSDNKKKSSLMLSIFEPNLPFPWLGNLNLLGPALELPVNPYSFDTKENAEETPFPVLPAKRRSYHPHNNNVWIKLSGLQSEIQKVIRYVKKLPEKQSAFFKEVNKLRRAGLCYGFHELLIHVADALEREGSSMPSEVNVQLRHVAEGLRNAPKRDLNQNIVAIEIFSSSRDR